MTDEELVELLKRLKDAKEAWKFPDVQVQMAAWIECVEARIDAHEKRLEKLEQNVYSRWRQT